MRGLSHRTFLRANEHYPAGLSTGRILSKKGKGVGTDGAGAARASTCSGGRGAPIAIAAAGGRSSDPSGNGPINPAASKNPIWKDALASDAADGVRLRLLHGAVVSAFAGDPDPGVSSKRDGCADRSLRRTA